MTTISHPYICGLFSTQQLTHYVAKHHFGGDVGGGDGGGGGGGGGGVCGGGGGWELAYKTFHNL